MNDEYWATFSIYDQQHAALYRKALMLFDRVVIPVPTEPIGKLTQEQIDVMAQEAGYLQHEGAGVYFEWKPSEFYEWQKKTIENEAVDSEALAIALQDDPPMATRMQLTEHYRRSVPGLLPQGVDSIIALPVYGSLARYESLTNTIRKDYPYEQMTLEIVAANLPVPNEDVALSDILHIRQTPHFRAALSALREWQMETVGELLNNFTESRFEMAKKKFENGLTKYREAMQEAKADKIEASVVSLLAVGGLLASGASAQPLLAALAALASPLFSVRKLKKPTWKTVQETSFAPAGVVYVAEQEIV